MNGNDDLDNKKSIMISATLQNEIELIENESNRIGFNLLFFLFIYFFILLLLKKKKKIIVIIKNRLSFI